MSTKARDESAGLRRVVAASATQAGFTLIEVLIALAILAVALPVLMSIFSDSLKRTRQSEARQIAASLSESLIAQAGTEKALRAGEESGEFAEGGGFHWRLQIEPYGSAADREVWSSGAFTVTATVTWGNEGESQSLRLTSLRLAPKGATP